MCEVALSGNLARGGVSSSVSSLDSRFPRNFAKYATGLVGRFSATSVRPFISGSPRAGKRCFVINLECLEGRIKVIC